MTPDLFTPAWFSALATIVLIDLVLAGDNAIVIGLAARSVPREKQRRVVLWGTAGAIIVRALLTFVVVWLLRIPAFLLIGGLALVYIGRKLTQNGDDEHRVEAPGSVAGAVRTIVIADAVMGIDNVLAVGGAAQGSMLLVIIGLAVSVPIVIWGSALVLEWVERFPAILWLGAAVLGWTAAKMIASEPLLKAWLDALPIARSLLYLLIVGGAGRGADVASVVAAPARAGRGAGAARGLVDVLGLGRRRDGHGVRSHGRVALGRRDRRSDPLDRLDSVHAVAVQADRRAGCGGVATRRVAVSLILARSTFERAAREARILASDHPNACAKSALRSS